MNDFFEAAWALRYVIGAGILIWVLASLAVYWEATLMALGSVFSGVRALGVLVVPRRRRR